LGRENEEQDLHTRLHFDLCHVADFLLTFGQDLAE
jgi:hypothetical protein